MLATWPYLDGDLCRSPFASDPDGFSSVFLAAFFAVRSRRVIDVRGFAQYLLIQYACAH